MLHELLPLLSPTIFTEQYSASFHFLPRFLEQHKRVDKHLPIGYSSTIHRPRNLFSKSSIPPFHGREIFLDTKLERKNSSKNEPHSKVSRINLLGGSTAGRTKRKQIPLSPNSFRRATNDALENVSVFRGPNEVNTIEQLRQFLPFVAD